MTDRPAPSAPLPASGKPPVVRLPQWASVVLVLILLGTCGAAGDRSPSADEIASQVSAVQDGGGAGPSAEEVEDLCRLVGAIAVRQGVSVDGVMSKDVLTRCHELARNPAAP